MRTSFSSAVLTLISIILYFFLARVLRVSKRHAWKTPGIYAFVSIQYQRSTSPHTAAYGEKEVLSSITFTSASISIADCMMDGLLRTLCGCVLCGEPSRDQGYLEVEMSIVEVTGSPLGASNKDEIFQSILLRYRSLWLTLSHPADRFEAQCPSVGRCVGYS